MNFVKNAPLSACHKSPIACLAAVITGFVLTMVVHSASAQKDSVSIPYLAEEYPEWLSAAVKADDFREPDNPSPLETKPYEDNTVKDADLLTTSVYYQPAGALSGKTVFAMAGHGWTYNSDRMIYFTQRGLSHGMVEDLGNADQMHIFAHLAFNAGATVVPFRPIDYQPNERILDNTMPQVELYGPWSTGKAKEFFGASDSLVPYGISKASLTESAIARYRPYIPESGNYPVYVWARDGADRINQTYQIRHSGGIAQVRVNWKRVGKAWVWLGTWHFNKGSQGYVETSNKTIDPYEAYSTHYAVADAVRFGNGMGDVPRPGGISGFSREDEGDCYWIERALGNNVDRRIFDIGADSNSTVSSPPKAAAYTNRENEGSFLDRILISFHSNASSGKARGAIALYNASAGQRPTYQETLAEIIGKEVNAQLIAEKAPTKEQWTARERNTYNGINFGELRRDYLQNEMCATLVETAFHDNAEDVSFLLDPTSRVRMAEATLRGVLKWYGEVISPNNTFVLPPSRPTSLAATQTNAGRVQITLKTPAPSELGGGPAQRVRIYRSQNGYGFDGGMDFLVNDTNTYTIDPITTNGTTFIRATLANLSGESLPSQAVAVGLVAKGESYEKPATLLIPLTTVLDRSSNSPYYLGSQPGGPYKETAWTERVRPYLAMVEPAGAAEALALTENGIAFDSAESDAVTNEQVKLTAYNRVFIAAESQNTESSLLSNRLISGVRSLLQNGGKVCISGSGIYNNLKTGNNRTRGFLSDVLGIQDFGTRPAGESLASANERFLPTTATLQLTPTLTTWNSRKISPISISGKKEQTLPLLTSGIKNHQIMGIITRPFYSAGEVISLGFPFSAVATPQDQALLMGALLKQL